MSEVLQTGLGFTLAFSLTLAGVYLLTPIARRFGLIDRPSGRKIHAVPTPITGGLAMLVGILVGTIFLFGDFGEATQGFAIAAVILTVLGILDDKFDLSWRLRIGVQIIAALAMIYVGGIRIEQLGDVFGLGPSSLGVLSVPFTVFATLGVINAVNMIDGSDGLAGVLVLCALVMLEAAALYSGNSPVYERAPILIGAVTGFLVYNLRFPGRPHARIFMGNAGSAFLGLTIACFSFRLTQNPAHPVGPILALWLIPIPIMDCLVLMVRRLRNRRSPFAADRNHIHHLMLDGGFGPTGIVAVLAAFSCATGLAAALVLRAHLPQVVLLLAFGFLCLTWYWLTSRRVRAVAFFRSLHRMFARQPRLGVLEQEGASE